MNPEVTVSKAFSVDGDYFRTRFDLLGKEKFVEFVRNEYPHWNQPRNLIIAKNVYKAKTGEELPSVSMADIQAEKDAEIRELKAQLAKKTEPVAVVADEEVVEVAEEKSVPKGVRRGRSST